MESVTVGLDIGSSAVRAAEIEVGKDGRRVLRRYAQVGMAPGYVADGEINNVPGVATALRRLWSEGGFSTNKVVLGISGPRVFVRQAEVPAMRAEDLRSSLRFDAQELVPIAMDDASFDFSLLDPAPRTDADGKTVQRILLVAAHRSLLATYTSTLKEAGLEATVMDAAPLALMRAVPRVPSDSGAGAMEVIVSVGSDLTTVAVREGEVPRFIRSLTVGGSRLTESIANAMHIDLAVAERLKRGAVAGASPQLAQARKAMVAEMRDVADEIRATIDFFMVQSDGGQIERLLITGGAAQTESLVHRVAGTMDVPLAVLNPLSALDTSALPYDRAEMDRISAGAATAIGLALWPTEAPLIRLTVLPEEIREARRLRRLMSAAGVGVAALIGVLGVAGVGEVMAVRSAQHQAHVAEQQVNTLNDRVSQLQAATAVHSAVQSKASQISSVLAGDVDWVRVLGQLATVMPPQLTMTGLSASRTASTPAAGGGPSVGTLSMTVKGNGGLPSAAAWLQGLGSDPDLSGVTISGISVKGNGGPVNFTSTAQLTPKSYSNRDKGVQR